MPLYFVTGNPNKFSDAKAFLGDVEQLDIDLPEIQGIDPHVIMKAKLEEAFKHHKGEFMLDDVSLRMDCLNGLPGPLIKWFIKSMGMDGIAALAEKLGNTKAEVSTIIAYAKSPEDIIFFEGRAKGDIVKPRGQGGFGWDVIFQPEGSDITYAEWKEQNPGPNAMRIEALTKLKNFLLGSKA
jgi:non-canonical purine NTP pyrophosphatase (RdgB/HAM1 family)